MRSRLEPLKYDGKRRLTFKFECGLTSRSTLGKESNHMEQPLLRIRGIKLPKLSATEAHNQYRDRLRCLGAARGTLWITDLSGSTAAMRRRTIWSAMNAPGEDAAISRDSLLLASRTFRLVERV
jgi:hypothetical protein